jgi:hypothetical protein
VTIRHLSTVSHWHATAQPRIRYRDLPATADLVVIGGGGAADTYLNVRARYGAQTAQAIWGYSARNRALLLEVIARDPVDFDFRQPGTMNFALTEQDAAGMRANIAAYEADGGPAGDSV